MRLRRQDPGFRAPAIQGALSNIASWGSLNLLGRTFPSLASTAPQDEMTSKMDSVKSLKVAAWQCKECGYTAEYPRKVCARHAEAVGLSGGLGLILRA